MAPGDDEGDIADARPRAVLIYDDLSGLCRRAVARWSPDRDGTAAADDDSPVEWLPRSAIGARFPEVRRDRLAEAPTLITPDGEVAAGVPALLGALSAQGHRLPRWAYDRFAGLAIALDALHGAVTRRRAALSRLAAALAGPDEGPPTHHVARWLLLRGLGVCALAAFLSVRAQLDGLLGARGLQPAVEVVAEVQAWTSAAGLGRLESIRRFPTLLSLRPTDGALHVLVGAGIAGAALLIVDVAPALGLAVVWLAYLSLVTVGEAFFHFQWDALLLEACLVAAFVVPWRVLPRLRDSRPPSPSGLWVVRLLVAKLMFLSGAVKLRSHDETWASLRALDYHYFTQPLPTWTAWWAHQAPAWTHRVEVAATLAIELGAPLLIFGTRRMRRLAFVALATLQLAIAATGNYGFFNLLSIVLCGVLLDDGAFPGALRARIERARRPPPRTPPTRPLRAMRRARRALRAGATALVLVVSATEALSALVRAPRETLPETLVDLAAWVAPLDSVHAYGLFRTMTTERAEIVVEGSADGVTWREYEFPWKPGDPRRVPAFVGLHMPRLDWELWFAALAGHCTRAPTYLALLRRLLDGSPSVRALLARDPFPDAPPRFVRSTLWDYRFTTRAERATTGAWWVRRRLGLYCPIVALQDGELSPVEPAGEPE